MFLVLTSYPALTICFKKFVLIAIVKKKKKKRRRKKGGGGRKKEKKKGGSKGGRSCGEGGGRERWSPAWTCTKGSE